MKRKLLLAMGLLLALLVFTGCCAGKKIIGVQAEGENVYKVDVTNDTKKTITKVQLQDNSMKDFSDNMIQNNSIFAAGETQTMYVNAEAAKAAAGKNAKSGENYQVKLTFDDKSEKTLTDVPFSDMKACHIKWDRDNGVAYLTYDSQKEGKEVSTKEAEIQKKQDAEKKAAEQKAAEQKAAAQKAAEQKAAEQRERENQSTTQSNDTGSGNENSGQNNTDYNNNYDNNYNSSYSESNGGYSGGETYQPADYGGEY